MAKEVLDYTWEQVEQDCLSIAQQILKGRLTYTIRKDIKLVAVSRGGCIPAIMLSNLLGVDVVGTLHIVKEDSPLGFKGKPFKRIIKLYLPYKIDPDNIVFVDDILDSGETLELIHKKYPRAGFLPMMVKESAANKYHDHVAMPNTPLTLTTVKDDVWVRFPWELDTLRA